MDAEDVARLATAIAKANGHTEPAEWVARVVAEWQGVTAEAPEPQEPVEGA